MITKIGWIFFAFNIFACVCCHFSKWAEIVFAVVSFSHNRMRLNDVTAAMLEE